MTKQDAIKLFTKKGSTHPVRDLADAVGVISQAISNWPDELEKYHIDKLKLAAEPLGLRRKLNKLLIAAGHVREETVEKARELAMGID